MDFGHYRLIGPLSAGRDGARYRARDARADVNVEIRVLGGLKPDPARAGRVEARLRAIRLLDHPSVQSLIDHRTDTPVPFHVVEEIEAPTLADLVAADRGRSMARWISLARDLAAAVEVGHRVGLAHGSLCPATIRIHPVRGPILDWTGVEVDAAALAASEGVRKSCRAPELGRDSVPTIEADRYSLGAVASWLISGRYPIEGKLAPLRDFPGVSELVAELTAFAPIERATAQDASRRLRPAPEPEPEPTQEFTRTADASVLTRTLNPSLEATLPLDRDGDHDHPAEPSGAFVESRKLGRFRLVEKLGQGGMGEVYRAEDMVDGASVAVKILTPKLSRKPQALKRFLKEARLLREVNSPHVANFIEVNEDGGVYFLALEYVAGSNLTAWMKQRPRLNAKTALAVSADVARALGVAHERGIVHRDVKPDNILVVAEGDAAPNVKLSDFGIAKAFEDEESTVLTQFGTILGTPLYMSPEQCAGDSAGMIGPWSDVYSLGATLFHMLTGRPPFLGDSALAVIQQHKSSPAPDVRSFNADVGEGVARVIEKCLAKRTQERYPDAGELLADFERLLRGEPTGIAVHPLLPDPGRADVVAFDWTFRLASPPDKLWPHVSNTERLNRAVGVPAVEYRDEPDPKTGARLLGTIKRAGIDVSWREHPFEWIEGRRLGVLREYSKGPFDWFMSVVELQPDGEGGTILSHRVRIAPKGLIGKGIAAVEIGAKGKRAVEAVYRRIDEAVRGRLGRGADADPFEPATELTGEPRRRIDRWLSALGRRGLDPGLIESVGDYVARGPIQELARVRPVALARKLGLDPEGTVAACLLGVREGIFQMLWDLLCPICRAPSRMLDSLRSLQDHGSCEACRAEFKLDFGESVELVLRVHPEIRPTAELGAYCRGGPGHAPHVAAQARVAPGERLQLDLSLREGSYRLRGPQLPYSVDFRVDDAAKSSRWELDLARGPGNAPPLRFKPRSQILNLSNPTDRELVVRVERTAPRSDALTAARASSISLFRSLFPGELLEPGRLIGLATVTLLVTDLPDARELYARLGDAGGFARIHEQFRLIDELTRKQNGALVKTVGEGVVAAFDDARDALRAALALPNYLRLSPATADLVPRIGLHRGSAMVATLNDRLDYFGATARLAQSLPSLASPGAVALTSGLASDPALAEMIAASGRRVDLVPADLPDLDEGFVHVVRVEKAGVKARGDRAEW